MDRENLMQMLEMDEPSDFEYFEQYADLVETKEAIEYDDFYYVISGAEKDTIAEITVNFFEELEKFIPNGSDDIFEIVDNVANNLKLLSNDFDSQEFKKDYIQKLFTFHEWYTKPGGAKVDGKECAIVDAIFEYRAQKLDNTEHSYDFSDSLDYDFDYLSMPIGGYTDNEYN